ncbi:MAG: hypothetical protein IPK67_11380 [Planctomycetes bacterium]|nr:hypothetical protein [Planctomycetota bacterium]
MVATVSGLVALCEVLRAKTRLEVFVGRPDEEVPGVHVWAWGLFEDVNVRNFRRPVASDADGTDNAGASPVLRVLVLVRPAHTLEGLARLCAVREVLLAMPILDVDGSRVRVTISSMEVDQLSRLFTAAALPLSLCLSVELRGA